MALFQKIKLWWRGKFITTPLDEILDNKTIPSDRYEQPFLAKALTAIGRFWFRNWKVLLPIIISVIAIIVMLFIHFDSKAARETKQKKDKTETKIYHLKTHITIA